MNKNLWCTVADGNRYWFQIFRNATSPKQRFIKIYIYLDFCRSLESTLATIRRIRWTKIMTLCYAILLWDLLLFWRDFQEETPSSFFPLKKLKLLNFVPILESAWKMHQNDYKHAYVWFSGSWDNLWCFIELFSHLIPIRSVKYITAIWHSVLLYIVYDKIAHTGYP